MDLKEKKQGKEVYMPELGEGKGRRNYVIMIM